MSKIVATILALGLAAYCALASARFIQPDPVGIVPTQTTPRALTASDVLRLNQPYLYVRGNPLRFIDPAGLTVQDIQNMLELVHVTQPDLNVPPSITPRSLGNDVYGQPIGGFTNPLSLDISISDRYLQKLNCKEIGELFETITHESIHRSRPRWDMISRPVTHPDIYADAARRAREAQELIKNYCPCPR
jgi:hypothetical protein